MKMISIGAMPFGGNLGSLFGGMSGSSPELFSPAEFVKWTNLKYIGDTDRKDRGMLLAADKAVALVRGLQLSYKEALSYDVCVPGCHVILFKGDDQVQDGVVSVSVGSVDNLALIMASNNLPDQVVIASSFAFGQNKLGRLNEELKRCGYLLVEDDDNTFSGDQKQWSHVLLDCENNVIIGYITKSNNRSMGDDLDGDMPSITHMFKQMTRMANNEEANIHLNLSTPDTVLIDALIDLFDSVSDLGETEGQFSHGG